MKKLFTTLLLCLLGVSLSRAADLATYQKIYDAETRKIEEKYLGLRVDAMAGYEKALSGLEKKLAGKGDLQGVMAVRKEQERFAGDRTPTIPEEQIVSEPQEIRELQKSYNAHYEKREKQKKQAISNLTKSYSSRLTTLKTTLTKSMKIDEALEVQKEIDRVASMISKPVKKAMPTGQPVKLRNIATEATIKASSYNGERYSPQKAADGIIGKHGEGEWVSSGQMEGAWIELTWKAPRIVHKVVLYDRQNSTDNIRGAVLKTDRSAEIHTGVLPKAACGRNQSVQ